VLDTAMGKVTLLFNSYLERAGVGSGFVEVHIQHCAMTPSEPFAP